MDRDTILILTCPEDTTADEVVEILHDRGANITSVDPGDFPLSMRSTTLIHGGWDSRLETTAGERLDLADVKSVWYRRPTHFRLPEGMSPAEQNFAAAETRLGFGGVLAAMDWPLWINHPHRIARAEYKPIGLRTAAQVGLTVPPTLISNDPGEVRGFVQVHPDVVCKPFSPLSFVNDGVLVSPYTARLTEADLDDEQIAVTVCLFQEWVPKDYEVRLTAVGHEVFSVAIRAHSDAARIDWRRDFDALAYEAIDTPDHIRHGVAAYLEAMGLAYGAFDFVVRPDGQWIFLECNPNGQWGWLPDEADVAIAPAFADVLMKGPR